MWIYWWFHNVQLCFLQATVSVSATALTARPKSLLTSAWAGWRPKSPRQSLFWFSQHRERNVKLKLLFARYVRKQSIYSTELLMWKQSPRLNLKSVVQQTQTSLVVPLLLRKRSIINLALSCISLKVCRWPWRSCYECLCHVACCWGGYSCQ